MSDFDQNAAAAQYGRPLTRAEAAVIDEGLRAYMLRIYNYMVLGLAITGFAALGVYMLSVTSDPSSACRAARFRSRGDVPDAARLWAVRSPLKWAVILAPLGLVFFLSFPHPEHASGDGADHLLDLCGAGRRVARVDLPDLHALLITRVFFITAASFGALSLWGYTTQRDLSGWGSFLIMGLFGIIIASLVNHLPASTTLQWIISVVGVLVFAGLTAYDTQRLKSEYIYGAMEGEVMERSAIMGALTLYLDFLNLFNLLLQSLGQREE